MKVITLNANGIRSAAKKGAFDWLVQENADVVCIQETKAQLDQLADEVFHPKGYHCFYHDAVKKGYSGTALYSKRAPEQVTMKLGIELSDNEGRWLQADYKDWTVVSLYMPSGTSGDERLNLKLKLMADLEPVMQALMDSGRYVVICADWNICHKEIDLKNWKPNQKNSGFLPVEREWLDRMFTEQGWVDSFRVINKEAEQYTWWSNRGQAWAKNVGWRLDYQLVTPNLRKKIKQADIYKDERFSDHAPHTMHYTGKLV